MTLLDKSTQFPQDLPRFWPELFLCLNYTFFKMAKNNIKMFAKNNRLITKESFALKTCSCAAPGRGWAGWWWGAGQVGWRSSSGGKPTRRQSCPPANVQSNQVRWKEELTLKRRVARRRGSWRAVSAQCRARSNQLESTLTLCSWLSLIAHIRLDGRKGLSGEVGTRWVHLVASDDVAEIAGSEGVQLP